MRNILFLFLFVFSVSVVGQSSTYEKYNNLTRRYEYFDTSTNKLIAYKTYNSLQKRWETTYINNNEKSEQSTRSDVNFELLNQVAKSKQQRYDYNSQRINSTIESIYNNIYKNFTQDIPYTAKELDYKFAKEVKNKFYKDYVAPLNGKSYDLSSDSKTNEIINYLHNGRRKIVDDIMRDLKMQSSQEVSKTKMQKGITTKEIFPRTQSVVSYAPFFKSPSLSDSQRIGTVKDNKVEVLEKYSESVYKVRHGNVTGYMAKLWFNN